MAIPIREHRLDSIMHGWIVNTAKRNIWRIPNWYDLDDLIGEGFICYAVCNIKYRHVRQTRQFMKLVQTTFRNHITDLANERTLSPEEVSVPPDSPLLVRAEIGDALLLTMLNQLPKELQVLITRLIGGTDLPRMKRYKNGVRETSNEYLCRLMGVDHKYVNVLEIFKEHVIS